jgi:hypothetical protein
LRFRDNLRDQKPFRFPPAVECLRH